MQAYVVRVRAEDGQTGEVAVEQLIEVAPTRRDAEVRAVRDTEQFYPRRAVRILA